MNDLDEFSRQSMAENSLMHRHEAAMRTIQWFMLGYEPWQNSASGKWLYPAPRKVASGILKHEEPQLLWGVYWRDI